MPPRPIPPSRARAAWLLLAGVLGCAAPVAPAPPPTWGQWIWTAEDASIYAGIRAKHPAVQAGVLVAELTYAAPVGDTPGGVTTALRMSPRVVDDPATAVVIRLDDSVHGLFAGRTEAEVAGALGERLARLVTLLHDHGGAPRELQLDYDVPVRLLPAWAAVLGRLTGPGGALHGETGWVTSILAHVRDPAYGTLLRGKVAGHLLQVFDTGESPEDSATVARLAANADLPYRLGIAAFERGREGVASTRHRDWFAQVGTACVAPRCEAVWVFPGGQPWELE